MKTKKSILFFSTIVLSIVFAVSCKKKKETPEPEPQPAPIPAHVNKMTAKLNGVDWAMACDQWGCYSVTSKTGNSFGFSGQTSASIPYTYIASRFNYTIGVVQLSKISPTTMIYKDLNDNYFTSVTGTLNITAFDSLGTFGLPKKMKATFSFKTDTVGGTSYNVTDGIIDYESN